MLERFSVRRDRKRRDAAVRMAIEATLFDERPDISMLEDGRRATPGAVPTAAGSAATVAACAAAASCATAASVAASIVSAARAPTHIAAAAARAAYIATASAGTARSVQSATGRRRSGGIAAVTISICEYSSAAIFEMRS